MSSIEWSWCPGCKRWVPRKKMQYFEGERLCYWCVEGLDTPERYTYEPCHERVQCIYCDSYNTEQMEDPSTWRCRDCGEISYLLS